jgi:RNA polymerase sigma-70 factor (ECF subfamily)
MDEADLNSRLSRISTMWTMLGQARADTSQAGQAQLALIQRYQGAVYRYLRGATHDPDVADELFQEFALRVVQGAFQRVDPERGRFRDYLRTTLIHLVTDYQNRKRRRAQPMDRIAVEAVAPMSAPEASDELFLTSWREELLAAAWAALERAERQGGQPYYSVLRFRSGNPEASSAEMAVRLSGQLQPPCPFTEAGIRKALQRARAQFADALIEEVAHSLDHPTHDALEQELIALNLLSYCRSALQRRAACQ